MPQNIVLAGRYRIESKLGSGGTGTVYRAHDNIADRTVALKVVRKRPLDPAVLESLQLEFESIASLRHPQIASAYDFGYSEEGLPFYTREYVDGRPLRPGPPTSSTANRRGTVSPIDFLSPFFDVLDALEYLHGQDVLHLDIHAGNVIESNQPDRGAVLIDLGLVGLHGSQTSGLSTPLLVRASTAPEVLRGEKTRPATDLFAVGGLLLYRLTGSSDNDAKLPRELPGWGERLTLDLERIISKALQPDPSQRFQSAAEFREALSASVGRPDSSRSVEPRVLTCGRDDEIESIDQALRSGADRRAAVVWFSGPTGIGKSRLVTEARLRAQLRGMRVIEARFVPDPVAEPPLLKALLSARGSRRGGNDWLRPLAADHGGSSLERARRAAESFFAEPEEPLVLILDDYDDADRESRLLVEALLAECEGQLGGRAPGRAAGGRRGLVIVAASRNGPPSTLPACGARRCHRKLKPLPLRASRELFEILVRPLEVPPALVKTYCQAAGGSPQRLRRIARTLHRDYGRAGVVPPDAPVPREPFDGMRPAAASRLDRVQLEVARVFAVIHRPARRDEIVAATALPPARAERAIKELVREEVLAAHRGGGACRYNFGDAKGREEILAGMSPTAVRRIHRRMVRFFRAVPHRDLATRESLVRHMLALGLGGGERRLVLETASLLRGAGRLENAKRILNQALARESDPPSRLRFAEEISALHDQAGDHEEGVKVLEPVYAGSFGPLGPRDAVRIRRRLGVHCHRAGMVERALEVFGEVASLADPRLDTEEIAIVESELAELRTLQGKYPEAELACQRGLELLERARQAGKGRGTRKEPFWLEMEVTLRASIGHLELRRMNLRRAKEELTLAAQLARDCSTANVRSRILNNLGIVHNQLNEFRQAEHSFHQAERLLLASGQRRGIVQIACNRALLAAKTAERLKSRQCTERASQLLQLYPEARLEFFVRQTEATVACFLGDLNSSVEAFRRALPLGRILGDAHMVQHGEMFFAEALIGCGHYQEALNQLHATARRAADSPVLGRMLQSRLYLLETLLGRSRSGSIARKRFESIPSTGVEFIEAWNELYAAIAASLSADTPPEDEALERLSRRFRVLAVPAGRRFAHVALLYSAMRAGDAAGVGAKREAIDAEEATGHRLLAVLEPLALAEAALFLGEVGKAVSALDAATGSIVGLPFLELDWRIEYVRARVAERQGDREAARTYLHRAMHTRDLLARPLPPGLRRKLVAHARFVPLIELAERLEMPGPRLATGRATEASERLGAIVGHSPGMVRVFETIRQLSDTEIPVLVRGDTGTGKDLVARAVHDMSPRRHGPFLALHCASLPGALFEAELFGYEQGAYTGAEKSSPGILESLAGGSLVLDEVASLSLESQAKLLRVLDSGVARRLGGATQRAIDVRFLASTSENLRDAVAAGRFREDLLYRLLGVEIDLPSLRSRREDIESLARHFLTLHARRLDRAVVKLSSAAVRRLEEYEWPGNVRELEMFILRLLVTNSPERPIEEDQVLELLPRSERAGLFSDELLAGRNLKDLKRELERSYLLRLFRETSGDIARMARALEIKKPALYVWLRRLGIDVRELRRSL